ncbi:MAG: cobalamin-dependent protein [Ignavibacteria bacterium]|nr:cobalamin-dependent protein [Ignavibacteria bacterium]
MIKESVYFSFLNALLISDKHRCAAIIHEQLENGINIREIYINIFQRAMHRIGKMWEQGKISIIEEHVATEIVSWLIDSISPGEPITAAGQSAVITCVDKEFHSLGARIVSHIFEINGWRTEYLGANTPSRKLNNFLKRKNPDVLAISFTFYMNYIRLLQLLQVISEQFPQLPVIYGGQACTAELVTRIAADYPMAIYINSIEDLELFLRSFTAKPGA